MQCQFCGLSTPGDLKWDGEWCCWDCLELYGLEDDEVTTYMNIPAGHLHVKVEITDISDGNL